MEDIRNTKSFNELTVDNNARKPRTGKVKHSATTIINLTLNLTQRDLADRSLMNMPIHNIDV